MFFQIKEFIKNKNSYYQSLNKLLQFLTVLLIIGSLLDFYFNNSSLDLTLKLHNDSFELIYIFYGSIILFLLKILFNLFLIINYFRYRALKSYSDNTLPTLTIIVPAFNESQFVYNTLESIVKSNYPKSKLKIISIDDGSEDDTWIWMCKAKEKYNDLISIYKQSNNQGKKAALYRGFLLSQSEILVTIDSDSIVKKDTLRNLVSPFIYNANCGAVAGNVKIFNSEKNIIPKMLNISFAISFEFIRAAQSNMKTVLCTPGALSAYRKNIVMNYLDEWRNQKFFGVLTDIGEDRTLSNMILKNGSDILYQSNAVVYTVVPENYKNLSKMFLRWERSKVIENFKMLKFILKNCRNNDNIRLRILFVNEFVNLISSIPIFLLMIYVLYLNTRIFISSALITVSFFSFFPAIYYWFLNKKNPILIFTYNFFYFFTLSWITPFSILTAAKKGWLTRSIKK
jgi:hyaluronan synthase